MNYGHFDLKNKEYVITRPDTPGLTEKYVWLLVSHIIYICFIGI